MKYILPIIILTTFLFGVSSKVAFAQGLPLSSFDNELTFVISPPRIVLKGKPGETLQTAVKFTNITESERTYKLSVFDFVVDRDGKTPIPVSERVSGRWSAAAWTSFSSREVQVKPGKTGQVDVILSIPENALPGGHYVMVTQEPKPEDKLIVAGQEIKPASAATIIPRVGSLLYITVAGDIHEEAFIRNFTAPDWVEFGPVPFTFTVENFSDIHITPQPTLQILNVFGKVVETIKVPPTNIFPFTTRTFSTEFDHIWGLGPYTAKLSIPYGESGKVLATSLIFWMIPYKIMLSILVILFSFLAIVIAIRRHLAHRSSQEMEHIEVLEERIKELEHKVHNSS